VKYKILDTISSQESRKKKEHLEQLEGKSEREVTRRGRRLEQAREGRLDHGAKATRKN